MTPLLPLLVHAWLQAPIEPPTVGHDDCLSAPPACVKAAGAHYDAGRFDEAIVLFEKLAYKFPEKPKYHYFAALAWEGKADDTNAYLHLRRYLVSNKLSVADRTRAEQRVSTIGTRTTRVLIKLPQRKELFALHLRRTSPSRSGEPTLKIPIANLPIVDGHREVLLQAGEWEISVDPSALGDAEVPPLPLIIGTGPERRSVELTLRTIRHELTVELGPSAALARGINLHLTQPGTSAALARGINLHLTQPGTPPVDLGSQSKLLRHDLPAGPWTYKATARGFYPAEGRLSLDKPAILTIDLKTKWPKERRHRLALGLGLGGAGIVTGIVGVSLFSLARTRLEDSRDEAVAKLMNNIPGETVDITALRFTDAGMGLLGASLGIVTGAATTAARYRRVWTAQSTVGATAVAIGIIWYSARYSSFGPVNPVPDSIFSGTEIRIAAGLLGLGTGLLSTAVTHLALNSASNPKRQRAATATPIASQRHIGIQVRIPF